jgi:hypothetical protein
MSQHVFETFLHAMPLTIVMGWDRPLQGFFLMVSKDDEEEEKYLYSNLEDPNLDRNNGMAHSLEYLEDKLAALGLSVPTEMLSELRKDCALNVGNRYVNHTPDRQAQAHEGGAA